MNATSPPLLLMTPGPTRVPERVLRAGATPMLHHRSPEFSRALAATLEGLRPLFGTRSQLLPIPTTGRGGMEAAIANLFSAGDQVAVCCNGKFGEMWAELTQIYGLVVHRIAVDWTRNVDPAEVDATLDRHRDIRGVFLTYCDTANGVRNDIAGVGAVTRRRGVLLLVDGVSSIGGMPFAFDEWGVDFAVTASQKCLMSSPGLAFVALSERGWASNKTARLPRSYWDFAEVQKFVRRPKPETPGTTPVHAMLQVAEALNVIEEEGIERVCQRHEAMAALVRRRLPELDLRLQCPQLSGLASTVTAIATPAGIEPSVIRQGLKQRGILTAAGLGRFEKTGFRIGHMGDIRPEDVERTLTALGEVLSGGGARSLAAS